MSSLPYGVGIPTRGRRERLISTLLAISKSDVPPALVVVIDNNDERMADLPSVRVIKIQHIWLPPAVMPIRGDAHGSILAMRAIVEAGLPVVVKWDDDLEPLPSCLGRLAGLVYEGKTPAAGGMYYQVKAGPCCHHEGDHIYVPDGNPRHLQFFQWNGAQRLIPRMHLYSSFAYDPAKVAQVGGFCPDYSRASYRHETDLTLRLSKKYGPLLVDTGAEAAHWLDAGGLREMDEEEYRACCKMDNALFIERMNMLGISPEY